MRKLFALEDAELEQPAVELETAPEVGEVATVELETTEATSDIQQDINNVDQGMEAADQLEKVEEVVENAAEADGLTPEAAEAVKVAVECICNTIGANPKAIFSIYATENFKSASTRKANTAIAKEGISNFISDLWEKIKAVLKSIWEKIVTFWRTYVVGLEKTRRSIKSMIEKIKNNKGNLTTKTIEKAPSSLINAFASTSNEAIGVNLIERYLDTCSEAQKKVVESFKTLSEANSAVISAIKNTNIKNTNDIAGKETLSEANLAVIPAIKNTNDIAGKEKNEKIFEVYNNSVNVYSLGSADRPLVGGIYVKATMEVIDSVVEKEQVRLKLENNKIENNVERGLNVASISDMVNMLNTLDGIVSTQIKIRDKIESTQANITKQHQEISKVLQEQATNKDISEESSKMIEKYRKEVLGAISDMSKVGAACVTTLTSTVPKLANATLSYVSLCNKQYKK